MSMNSAIVVPSFPAWRPSCVRDTISVMRGSALDHDRDTAGPDRTTAGGGSPLGGLSSQVLQQALSRLRLEGAVFLRAEYRDPWAYESLSGPETAKILHPDSA